MFAVLIAYNSDENGRRASRGERVDQKVCEEKSRRGDGARGAGEISQQFMSIQGRETS